MSKICIVGAGMTGLTLAQKLAAAGHAVTVYEREAQLGGLATYYDYGSFFWDRFYHVILPCDTHLINYLNEIGLKNELRWQKSLTGFYIDGKFYSLSSSLEFALFPPLNLAQKVRLALTILYCARMKNWQKLERIGVEEWLIKTCGKKTFDKLWKPLLYAKLGECYKRVSAVFIWTYIKRTFAAKESSSKKEQLGHVRGGYRTVLRQMQKLILRANGRLRLGVEVQRIYANSHRGLWVKCDGHEEHFDRVIFTSPTNVLQRVAPELVDVKGNGCTVEYLGVVCMVLITTRPLTPYYVTNLADEQLPFTGVVSMSSVVPTEETSGKYITYFPKYIASNEPMLRAPDEEIRQRFFKGIKKVFPDLRESEIESVHINRAVKVQPLQVLNYSSCIPSIETKHRDFFVLNTAQFVNDTLNNNSVVRHVEQFLQQQGHVFKVAKFDHNHQTVI